MRRSGLRQAIAVTRLNFAALPQRLGPSLVAVVGIGGVVAVLIAVLSISAGFRAALALSGQEDVVIVLRGGSEDEMSSGLGVEDARIVSDAPQIRRGAAGPVVSAELYVVVDQPSIGRGTPANVPVRGVGPEAPGLRRAFRIVAGRMFRTGLEEVIVGRGAQAQFQGLGLGDRLRLGDAEWTVTGVFEDGGSVAEGEIWTDAVLLQGAYKRGASYQSLRVRLRAPGELAALRARLAADPRTNVSVRTERQFLDDQSRQLAGIINTVGVLIALMMGVGAVFAALNTMYAAVASRAREIATLRALGFGATPVLASVLLEALLLGLAGGVAGAALAYAGFNGYQASTLNWSSFTQVSFAFRVTPTLMLAGVGYALLLGLVGGLLPGLRAARQPVTAGLREL
ncbi:MAG: FtsX-like permease family protein [Steroidobacteraceae bacterium]